MSKNKELKLLHKTYDRLCNLMSKEKADYFMKAHIVNALEHGEIDFESARKLTDELKIDFTM